jgi:hypothetical protein
LKACTLFLMALPLAAADAPRLFLSKSFPNSSPAYMEAVVERDGKVTYREDPKDENPVTFSLAAADVDALFQAAELAGRFAKPLESGLKVARMGEKLFRWEQGEEKHEVRFNYTQDPDGAAVLDWLERLAETSRLFYDLERTAKYDRLGVNQALLQIEAAWDRRRLATTALYLPLLDRIEKNEGYLNMARERASRLAAAFRNPPAHAEPKKP